MIQVRVGPWVALKGICPNNCRKGQYQRRVVQHTNGAVQKEYRCTNCKTQWNHKNETMHYEEVRK